MPAKPSVPARPLHWDSSSNSQKWVVTSDFRGGYLLIKYVYKKITIVSLDGSTSTARKLASCGHHADSTRIQPGVPIHSIWSRRLVWSVPYNVTAKCVGPWAIHFPVRSTLLNPRAHWCLEILLHTVVSSVLIRILYKNCCNSDFVPSKYVWCL